MALLTRAQFLRGRSGGRSDVRRPPWSGDEASFVANCSRCGDCVRACPEHVLVSREGGYPEIDFTAGGCSFCGACADACRPGAIQRAGHSPIPWRAYVRIADNCLALKGVVCRSCGDACPRRAIHFSLRTGGLSIPSIDVAECSGCGYCVAPCPVAAVRIDMPASLAEAGGRAR